MSSRNWTLRLFTTLAALLVFPSSSTAAPGDGLEAGNLILSPGASLITGFDTNLFRLSFSERTPIAAPSVQLVPFLTIGSVYPDLVDFRFDGRVGWQQYIPIGGENVVVGQSGLAADVGAGLTFNRAGAVSFAIEDRLQRTNEAPPDPDSESYNRLVNRAGATLGLHPGGRVFQHYLSYDWMLYLFDELPDLNKQIHDFTLKNYWRFLPKTAFVLNGDFQIVQYAQPTRASAPFPNVNSTPLRVSGGLSGLITRRLSLRVLGGWGWGFYAQAASFTGLVVDTQAAFAFGNLNEKNKLFLGYERNFQDASIANFASYHRPYAGYEQGFGNNRLRLSIRAEAMVKDYQGAPQGTIPLPNGETLVINGPLNDLLIGANAGLEFNIYRWWAVGLRYSFQANFTDDRFAVSNGDEVVREYFRHVILLSTTVKY